MTMAQPSSMCVIRTNMLLGISPMPSISRYQSYERGSPKCRPWLSVGRCCCTAWSASVATWPIASCGSAALNR